MASGQLKKIRSLSIKMVVKQENYRNMLRWGFKFS